MIHACAEPVIVMDRRMDRLYDPPEPDVRPRCTTCGWQGSWRKVPA